MYIKKRMSKTYRQEIENLTEKQLYDEILWHNIGDGEDQKDVKLNWEHFKKYSRNV